MSDFLVGNELLPNVYIKNVQILQGYDDDNVSLQAHVCIVDTSSFGVKKLWSNNPRIASAMSLLFVACSVEDVGDLITDGNVDFSERAILAKANQFQNRDDFIMPTIISKPFTTKTKSSEMGGYRYYNFTFNFNHDLTKSELKIFCAVYLDETKVRATSAMAAMRSERSYSGPVSSETIFQKSKINRTTTVFLNPNGSQYIGPVHMQNGEYMAGSTHTNTSHSKLTTTEIFNYKLKDYRKINPNLHSNSEINKKDLFYTPFTDLYDSVTDAGAITGLFGLNTKDILIRKTKFGKSLEKLNPTILDSIVSNFKINNLTIIRDRVNTLIGTNKLGSPVETYRGSMGKEYIITSYDEGGAIKPLTRLSKNRDFHYDVVLEDLPTLGAFEDPKQGQIYTNNLSKYNTKGSIREIYLDQKNIRFFEFEDGQMNDDRIGEYMYEIDLSFKDPTIPFVQSLFDTAYQAIKKVKDYYNIMSSNKNYNYDMNQTKENFFDSQDLLYQDDYSSAPWVEGPSILSKIYSYLYKMEDGHLNTILEDFSSKLNPRFATVKSVSYFIENFERMIHKMINYFSFSPNQIKENSLQVFPKNTPKSTLVKMEYRFKKVLAPVENTKRYSFLQADYNFGLLKISPATFLNRLVQEQSKLFRDGPPIYNSEEPVDPQLAASLADTTGFSSGYISPVTVRDKGVLINLKDPETVDLSEFNKLFDNMDFEPPPRPTRRRRTVRRPRRRKRGRKKVSRIMALMGGGAKLSVSEADLIDATEDQEELHVSSSEYLGDDSSFVIYDKDLFLKLNPVMQATLTSIQTQFSTMGPGGVMSKKDFDIDNKSNAVYKIKDSLSPKNFSTKLFNLPNHIKALFMSKGSKSKINLFKRSDILIQRDSQLLSKVSYFTIAKVEVLSGFEKVKGTGEILLNKPIWSLLNPDDLLDLATYNFCRMTYHIDKDFGIGTDERTELAYSNKYFFISRKDLYQPDSTTITADADTDNVLSDYFASVDFDISQATSNIIAQISGFTVNAPVTPSLSEAPTMGGTAATTTTGGSYYGN